MATIRSYSRSPASTRASSRTPSQETIGLAQPHGPKYTFDSSLIGGGGSFSRKRRSAGFFARLRNKLCFCHVDRAEEDCLAEEQELSGGGGGRGKCPAGWLCAGCSSDQHKLRVIQTRRGVEPPVNLPVKNRTGTRCGDEIIDCCVGTPEYAEGWAERCKKSFVGGNRSDSIERASGHGRKTSGVTNATNDQKSDRTTHREERMARTMDRSVGTKRASDCEGAVKCRTLDCSERTRRTTNREQSPAGERMTSGSGRKMNRGSVRRGNGDTVDRIFDSGAESTTAVKICDRSLVRNEELTRAGISERVATGNSMALNPADESVPSVHRSCNLRGLLCTVSRKTRPAETSTASSDLTASLQRAVCRNKEPLRGRGGASNCATLPRSATPTHFMTCADSATHSRRTNRPDSRPRSSTPTNQTADAAAANACADIRRLSVADHDVKCDGSAARLLKRDDSGTAGGSRSDSGDFATLDTDDEDEIYESYETTEPPHPPPPFYDQVRDGPSCATPPGVTALAGGGGWSLSAELGRLARHGWYWGPITRLEAEEKLAGQPDGTFLVRDSSDDHYLLSLSFRSYARTLHTRIEHCNGAFSLYTQAAETEGYASIVELVERSVSDSQTGVFCYSRARTVGSPSFPVRLTRPVSRFAKVRSLQYLCRFVIRQHTRVDHIQRLPLPGAIRGFLEERQY